MTSRPILFSGPMVRALLDGTKTQTRRALRPDQGLFREGQEGVDCWTGFMGWQSVEWAFANRGACGKGCLPRIAVGDLLWVRERGWMSPRKDAFLPLVDNEGKAPTSPQDGAPYKATPSIHMPRWASRLTLEVTEVRVQRLHEISEADAEAEGCLFDAEKRWWHVPGVEHPNKDFPVLARPTAREMYAALWDAINGSGAWGGSPWVVAYTFTVHRENVDDLLAERGRAAA